MGLRLASFVVVGFLLIYLMGYWEDAIHTTTLVLVATFIALNLEFHWESSRQNRTADMIIRPILDFMQTMPAFVY